MYATIVYADKFMSTQLFSDSWESATTQRKTAALTMATRAIDGTKALAVGFKGQKNDPDQEWEFPRDDKEIPRQIKDACCLEALELLKRGDDGRAKAIREGVTEFTTGKFSESYRTEGRRALVNQYMLSLDAFSLVEPFLQRGGAYPIG